MLAIAAAGAAGAAGLPPAGRGRSSRPRRARGRSRRSASTSCRPPGAAATPLHAFQGITFPLSVLADRGRCRCVGWRRLPRARADRRSSRSRSPRSPRPSTSSYIARQLARPTAGNANFITARRARRARTTWPRARRPAACSRAAISARWCPGNTGRRRCVGDCLWSQPNCYARGRGSPQALFDGTLTHADGAHVRDADSGARFVLADCETHGEPAHGARADASSRRSGSAARPCTSSTAPSRPARPSGRIPRRCGCSRSEAPIASSATRRSAILDATDALMRELMERNALDARGDGQLHLHAHRRPRRRVPGRRRPPARPRPGAAAVRARDPGPGLAAAA